MNTLDKILDEWDNDCNIDRTEPGKALLDIPKLHSKYLRTLLNYKLKLKQCEDEYNAERKIRYNYYNGNYNTDKEMLTKLGLEPMKMVLKSDINIYMEADEVLSKLSNRKAYYKEAITACEYIIQELKNRTFELRSYIDWEKFINGS